MALIQASRFFYLVVVPFWYVWVAYRASLVEQWFAFWHNVVLPLARPNADRYAAGLAVAKFR